MARSPSLTEKPSLEGYQAWLRRRFRDNPELQAGKAYHDEVVARLLAQVEGSRFWKKALERIPETAAEYLVATDYDLMAWPHDGKFQTKPWASLLDKTFRKNVLNNEAFPEAPSGGWLLPPTWYARIDDVVRTTFVVRYLDGVHELGRGLEAVAREVGVGVTPELVATEHGYYAAHLTVRQGLEVPTRGFTTIPLDIGIEIQVTTQAKEVLRKLLHITYESSRLGTVDGDWQWLYDERPFAANYLGHVMHYVEGRIMNIRRADAREDGWS